MSDSASSEKTSFSGVTISTLNFLAMQFRELRNERHDQQERRHRHQDQPRAPDALPEDHQEEPDEERDPRQGGSQRLLQGFTTKSQRTQRRTISVGFASPGSSMMPFSRRPFSSPSPSHR